MSDSLARWRLAALSAAAVVVAPVPSTWVREALRPPTSPGAIGAEATFVGRQACARCHEKESQA